MNTVEKSPAKEIAYFDILNVLATLSVVWIHFGNEVHWYDGSSAWKMCVPIQVLAYWAVPVFFMFTGATLMTYREKYDTKTFFRRRLYRGSHKGTDSGQTDKGGESPQRAARRFAAYRH